MHLAHLRLRDFRNYTRLDADFAPGFHLLLGDNAQGKTNILEAVYLMATLRSFRGVGGAQMVRHGQKGYFVGGNVTGQGEHEVKIYWSARERKLALDGQPVKRLGDYLGTLRAVVFCTEDVQLVKGAARARRACAPPSTASSSPTVASSASTASSSPPAPAAPFRARTTIPAGMETATKRTSAVTAARATRPNATISWPKSKRRRKLKPDRSNFGN